MPEFPTAEEQHVKAASARAAFQFTPENFTNPDLCAKFDTLEIIDVPVTEVKSDADLIGYGYLVDAPDTDEFVFRKKKKGDADDAKRRKFEIKPWPVSGWRQLDPETGDEAGTTEGDFEVEWRGDKFCGKNLAINTVNNEYLDGIGCADPRKAVDCDATCVGPKEEQSFFGASVFLWMSDYHPDGGQLFWPKWGTKAGQEGTLLATGDFDFFVCLGQNTHGDDVKPEHMRGFKIPRGKGVYFHPGTWHNGVYVNRNDVKKATFMTRQGRVHARVSCSWAAEFGKLLRMRLE